MKIGIGLPTTMAVPGTTVIDWARRAEERGFACLATIDRIVYPTFDSLTALAAAAGATTRIGLFTDILLAPLYPPVWLAKASATLDALSGGRLTLGLGIGGRPDDYDAMRRPMNRRGAIMDSTIDLLHRAWAGEPVGGGGVAVGPATTTGRIPILAGGMSGAAIDRAVRCEGYTAGGGPAAMLAPVAERVRAAWSAAGRDGEPRIAALAYFGLSDEAASRRTLANYYAFLPDHRDSIVEGGLRTPDAIRSALRAYEDAGATEVVLNPTVPDLSEVDRLADLVL